MWSSNSSGDTMGNMLMWIYSWVPRNGWCVDWIVADNTDSREQNGSDAIERSTRELIANTGFI